jgi:hypothetical protein
VVTSNRVESDVISFTVSTMFILFFFFLFFELLCFNSNGDRTIYSSLFQLIQSSWIRPQFMKRTAHDCSKTYRTVNRFWCYTSGALVNLLFFRCNWGPRLSNMAAWLRAVVIAFMLSSKGPRLKSGDVCHVILQATGRRNVILALLLYVRKVLPFECRPEVWLYLKFFWLSFEANFAIKLWTSSLPHLITIFQDSSTLSVLSFPVRELT